MNYTRFVVPHQWDGELWTCLRCRHVGPDPCDCRCHTEQTPEGLVATVRRAVEHRIHDVGPQQWYVDEHCIDCDADEVWRVVDEAVRAHLAVP